MPVQNHMHLSTTLQTDGEYAPDRKWVTTERFPIPVVIQAQRRTHTGVLRVHNLRRNNQTVRLMNWRYTLKVSGDEQETVDEKLAALYAMWGASDLYLVDHIHADDGSSHASDVRRVQIRLFNEPQAYSTALQTYAVTIELEDDSLTF